MVVEMLPIGHHVYVGHSGGKDSCVVYHLASRLYPDIDLLHTPKPNIHPATKDFVFELAQEKTMFFVPSSNMLFFTLRMGFRVQIDGTREFEHTRTDKSSTHIVDGVDVTRKGMKPVVQNGIFGLTLAYPIYDWTDADVFQYINENKIKLSKEYDNLLIGEHYEIG